MSSDFEEKEVREEEHVDVEDMDHRISKRARRRSKPKTGWWQGDETHTVKDDEGRSEGEPDGSPRKEQRSGRGSGISARSNLSRSVRK